MRAEEEEEKGGEISSLLIAVRGKKGKTRMVFFALEVNVLRTG